MIGTQTGQPATPPAATQASAPPGTVPGAINWRAAGRTAIITALLIFTLYVMTLIPKTIEVFVIATLVAYGLNPIVRSLTRRMPRAWAIIVVYALLIVAALALFLILVPAVLEQSQRIFDNTPVYVENTRTFLAHAEAWLKAHLGPLFATGQISQMETTVVDKLSTGVEGLIGSASVIVVGIANGVVVAIFGVILSYFFLANSAAIRTSFYSFFPQGAQEQARLFSREVGRVVGGFIVGQTSLCAICFILTYVLLVIFKSEYPLLLAALAGVCYAIPYIGVFIAAIAAFLLGSLTSWQLAVEATLIIIVTSKITDFLVPKVMGETVGVSPMAIIVAVFAGGELFGLWGVILAIPAAAVFKVIWMLWLHPWLTGKPFKDELPEPAAAAAQAPEPQTHAAQ